MKKALALITLCLSLHQHFYMKTIISRPPNLEQRIKETINNQRPDTNRFEKLLKRRKPLFNDFTSSEIKQKCDLQDYHAFLQKLGQLICNNEFLEKNEKYTLITIICKHKITDPTLLAKFKKKEV